MYVNSLDAHNNLMRQVIITLLSHFTDDENEAEKS